MKKYKVTGKFSVLNESDDVIKDEIFINKIIREKNPRLAMESVINIMTEIYSEKYNRVVKLQKISNVLVKRV